MSTIDDATDGPAAAWQRYLRAGEIRLQHCDACEAVVFYPRAVCPACGAERLTWRPASGAGTVYSTTVVRRRPDRGGDYDVSLIDLDEGVRMMSRVEGIAPDAVPIGLRVSAAIDTLGDDLGLVFRPAATSEVVA